MILSFRRPSGDPVLEAFADLTHGWLADVRRIADHEGIPFATGTGAGVLVASDVLVELHGHHASWDKLDVEEVERWLVDHGGGLARATQLVLADLWVFTNVLVLLGRLPDRIAAAVHARVERMVEDEIGAEPGDLTARATQHEPPGPAGPPNRAARRAAERARRRMH